MVGIHILKIQAEYHQSLKEKAEAVEDRKNDDVILGPEPMAIR